MRSVLDSTYRDNLKMRMMQSQLGPLYLMNKHLNDWPQGKQLVLFPWDPQHEGERKQNLLFPEGPVIKCFVILPDSKIEKNCEQMSCLTRTKASLAARVAVKPHYGQTKLYYRNETTIVFFFAANKNKDGKALFSSSNV